MNPDLNIKDYKYRVCTETENVFNDKLWEGLDGAITALDNVKARQYVDARCLYYEKPLFEAGTTGCMCNSEVYIPYKTGSYND